MMYIHSRGFTLLISIILVSVALSIGVALLDIATKQVILAAGARQSQVAFYNADMAMECALYWDQKQNAFDYSSPAEEVRCGTASTTVTAAGGSSPRTRTFTISCPGGGTAGSVTIYKESTGAATLFSSGYNTCDATNPRRIERGLKVSY
jgi:hypothetical protein